MVLQYKVLLKVGKQNRGELESMLNRIKPPMRPNQEDSISQLAIRLVRRVAGLTPVTTDLDFFPPERHGPIFPPSSWAKSDIWALVLSYMATHIVSMYTGYVHIYYAIRATRRIYLFMNNLCTSHAIG